MATFWFLILVYFINNILYICQSIRAGPPTPNATLSYWLIDAPFQALRLGDRPTSVDITVIGAGMSGSSTIYHLIQNLNAMKNLNNVTNILLIDSRGASGGATGRNGGGLGVSGSSTFVSTLNKYGNKSAIDRWNFTLQDVNDIKSFIKSKDWLIDTIQNGYSMGPLNYTDIAQVEYEMKIFEQYVGAQNCNETVLNKQETDLYSHSDSWQSSEYDGNCAMFWPAKVVFGLINDSILMSNNTMNIDGNSNVNLNIQFQTTVHSVTATNEKKWTLMVTDDMNNDNQQYEIISDVVVFATNAYTSYLLPEYSGRIVPAKNQVIMSEPWDYFIWNEASCGLGDNYEYWPQRIQDNKILIGGGRNAVNEDENMWIGNYNDSYIDANVSNYLQTFLSTLFPEIANSTNGGIEIQIEWQGIMGFSNDYIPWIGPLKQENDNRYICAGFTGNGMPYTFGGGKAIASMILGQTPQNFADIFLPYYPGRQ